MRLGFRQIDGFKWVDADEERLKRMQSLSRGAEISPHDGHEVIALPLPLAGEVGVGVFRESRSWERATRIALAMRCDLRASSLAGPRKRER